MEKESVLCVSVKIMVYRFYNGLRMWMQGRNGPDQLYKFLLYLSFVILVLNAFLRSWIVELILLLVIAFSGVSDVFQKCGKASERESDLSQCKNIRGSLFSSYPFSYRKSKNKCISQMSAVQDGTLYASKKKENIKSAAHVATTILR